MTSIDTDIIDCMVQRARVLPLRWYANRPVPRLLLSESELQLWGARLAKLLEQLAEVAPRDPVRAYTCAGALVLEVGEASRSLSLVLDDELLRGLYRPATAAPGAEVKQVELPADPELADLRLLVRDYRGAPQWQGTQSSLVPAAMSGAAPFQGLLGGKSSTSNLTGAYAFC